MVIQTAQGALGACAGPTRVPQASEAKLLFSREGKRRANAVQCFYVLSAGGGRGGHLVDGRLLAVIRTAGFWTVSFWTAICWTAVCWTFVFYIVVRRAAVFWDLNVVWLELC